MKIITLETSFSKITMEQPKDGAKVKITIMRRFEWEKRSCKEIVYADKDAANKFYMNRIKDGFKEV